MRNFARGATTWAPGSSTRSRGPPRSRRGGGARDVARGALELAEEQLRQSQDRFAAGVAGNLEVVQAQDAEAAASDNYLSALYAHNIAKVALARATGSAERTLPAFLGGDGERHDDRNGHRAFRGDPGGTGAERPPHQAGARRAPSRCHRGRDRLSRLLDVLERARDHGRRADRGQHRADRRPRRRHGQERPGERQPARAGRDRAGRIEPVDYEVALRKAEAELADARAATAAAPAAITRRPRRASWPTRGQPSPRRRSGRGHARVAEAEATREGGADLTRYRQLVLKDEISHQQYDTAVAGETAARSSVRRPRRHRRLEEPGRAGGAQRRAARTAAQQVEVARPGPTRQRRSREGRRARAGQAQPGVHEVKAPAPGSSAGRPSARPGRPARPTTPRARLARADVGRRELQGKPAPQDASRTAGQHHVDAYARTYRGHIESIGGATAAKFSLLPPENATGNFVKVVQRVPVKIVFEKGQDREHLLRPGMSVVPTVLTG